MQDIQYILKQLHNLKEGATKLPSFFIGHGSPMNAVEENDITRNWKKLGETLEDIPQAILCISAHWITRGETKVHISRTPKQIFDFYGFPEYLYEKKYNPEWSPKFARETIEMVKKVSIKDDSEWGIDHGTWSVLAQMYPDANIPIYQISLDYDKPFSWHFALAKELQELRKKWVLIIGSGNLVHNLQRMMFWGQPFDWNIEFDRIVSGQVMDRDFGSILQKKGVESIFSSAHPTHDHYLPLLYFLWTIDTQDQLDFFNDTLEMGSISMRSFIAY